MPRQKGRPRMSGVAAFSLGLIHGHRVPEDEEIPDRERLGRDARRMENLVDVSGLESSRYRFQRDDSLPELVSRCLARDYVPSSSHDYPLFPLRYVLNDARLVVVFFLVFFVFLARAGAARSGARPPDGKSSGKDSISCLHMSTIDPHV